MCEKYQQGWEIISNGVTVKIIQLEESRPTAAQWTTLVLSQKCMLDNYIEAAALIEIGEKVKGEAQICWRCSEAITTKVTRVG
jgi:hypothetical protein